MTHKASDRWESLGLNSLVSTKERGRKNSPPRGGSQPLP